MANTIGIPKNAVIVKVNEADPNVTMTANTPSTPTPIFTLTIPLGVERYLVTGTKFRMKLIDSGGDDIPRTSVIYLAYKRPVDDIPVTFFKFSYAPYYSLSLAEQLDESAYSQQLRVALPQVFYRFRQQTQLIMLLNSSVAIVPASSTVEFNMYEVPVAV